MSEARPRILIVEDEAIIAMDMAQHLRDFGYEVVGIAASGERAIQLADEARPDLVMMDIVIKGARDGIETARALRATRDLPVVFLTAYGDQSTLARAKQAAPHGYLLKPFRPNDLRTTIEVALNQQALERRARESDRWLTRTLQCIGDGVIATDPQGRVRFMNAPAEHLAGCSAREAEGRLVTEVFSLKADAGDRALPSLLHDAVALPGRQRLQRGLLHAGTGEPRLFVDVGVTPIRDADGQLLGGVLVMRDVTRERLDAQELARYRDHLESLVRERTAELETAKLAAEQASSARMTFLSNVSHEVRTPLNAVMGFSQLLALETLTLRQSGFVRQIEDAGSHMLRVLDDLLDMAKIDAGRLAVACVEVAVGDAVSRAIGMIESVASAAGVTMHHEPAPAEWSVAADPMRLTQVLFNLLSNAIKYNHRGGEVRVACSVRPGGRIRIAVRDTGAGISPEQQQRLFRVFERLEAEGSGVAGTGLGLAFSKRITALMGGELGLDSVVGEGSTFWVDLPRWVPAG